MDNKRTTISGILILAAIGLLIAIYYSPTWWVSLTAPNYPEEAFPDGVRIHFHMNGVFNGCKKVEKTEITEEEALDCVHEMNIINHFIGMHPIEHFAQYELMLAPYLILGIGLLALIFLYFANIWFGTSIGGLMDGEYINQPMSWAKFKSVLEHLWVPVLIIGTAGTAAMIRRLRANLLDELQKQYFVTALAKGLPPRRALVKYPLRMALNPFIADIGSILPDLLSGATIVSVVLSLQTTGPILLSALQSQDMYLAGSFVLLLAVMTVIGVLVSDLALAVLDPRIRLGGGATR